MTSSEVICYMNPLPAGVQQTIPATSWKGDDPPPNPNPKGKGDPKGKGKGKGPSIAELLKKMPSNCVSKMPDGKFLCLRYQTGQCFHQRKKRCNNGLQAYTSVTSKAVTKIGLIRSATTDKVMKSPCMTEFQNR